MAGLEEKIPPADTVETTPKPDWESVLRNGKYYAG
jgi:hypothetical protein